MSSFQRGDSKREGKKITDLRRSSKSIGQQLSIQQGMRDKKY